MRADETLTRHDRLYAAAVEAPAEYGMVPFWFWNDDLDEGELLRQLHAFRDGGFGGVIVHPRTGLSRRIGYLTDAYFRLVRLVVEECAALGLKIILYDEGGYPSGSACGRVVEANPEHAARALALVQRDVVGPWRGYWRAAIGRSLVNRLVSVSLGRVEDGHVDPSSLRQLDADERDVARIEVGPGVWRAMACVDVPSGGTIRGVLPEEEDGTAMAPPAGDILSPEAVASFIRLTHDAYAAHLAGHLGTTVIGLFTDEPAPLGRRVRSDFRPYTLGLDGWLAQRLGRDVDDVRKWLPALWLDYGPETAAFRRAYASAVEARLVEVFYAAQADWCERHGLAITGHPATSADMASLAPFDWPGQDMVWRYVVPGDESGLVGAHSVAAKAATSAARARGRRRAGAELYGAYGWRLSLDEAKWLLDWHLVRGNNLLMPHALFYSVRGGRAFESEPDLALHNPWWRHFPRLARYGRRLSWLLTDCEEVCEVAILGEGTALPWRAARELYERQVGFLYLDDASLSRSVVEGGYLRSAGQRYRVVVVDGPVDLSPEAKRRLAGLEAEGGLVLEYEPGHDLAAAARPWTRADVRAEPAAPGLRVLHVCKHSLEVYVLHNEGESVIESVLEAPTPGAAEWWDLLRETREPAVPEDPPSEAGARYRLRLDRRESRVLVVDPAQPPRLTEPTAPWSEPEVVEVAGPWAVTDEADRPAGVTAPGDWSQAEGLERFGGTLLYTTRVRLSASVDRVEVDLGTVGESAEVTVNGVPVGWALWAPYRIDSPGAAWRVGENRLTVAVTNSAANSYEGAMRPSGLLGPVQLRFWRGERR